MNKTPICLLMFIAISLLVPFSTWACSCSPPPPPKESLKLSKAVFLGTVTTIALDKKYGKLVTFKIIKYWKGIDKPIVSLWTAKSGASCGYGFKEGEKYLVYAYGQEDGDIRTSICTRTRPLSHAEKDLKALGPGKEPEKDKDK